MRFDDELKRIVAGLPTELKSDRGSPRRFARHHTAQGPAYWFCRISHAEASELLGMTPGALRGARSRGGGPPGYTEIDGCWFSPSRMAVLEWIRIGCAVATADEVIMYKEAEHA